MPYRLPPTVHDMVAAADPRTVLDVLEAKADPLHLMHVWPLRDGFKTTFIFHDSVPTALRRDHNAWHAEHGVNAMPAVFADPLPWTYNEAFARTKPQLDGMANLLNDHGVRDGFAVNHQGWAVAYWSERRLDGRFDRETRMSLTLAAEAAIVRLTELAARERGDICTLTPEELEVLELLARGMRLPTIAKRTETSWHTVRNRARRIQKKLGAVTLPQATFIAVKRGII